MTPSELADEAQMCIWRPDAARLAEMLAEGLASALPAGGADQGRLLSSAVNRYKESPALLGMLLRAGFVADARGEFEDTAFLKAVRYGMPEPVRLLLEGGADPYFVNFAGANALSMMVGVCRCGCAPEEDRAAVGAMLRSFDLKPNPKSPHFVQEALRMGEHPGSGELIRELREYGVPLDCLLWSPLMLEIVLGTASPELIAAEDLPALERRDSWNRTPFLLAVQCGRVEAVKDLIQCGCDVQALGDKGKNALHYAAAGGHLELVEELLALGLALESVDTGGETPLMLAIQEHELDAVKLLLARGGAVNAENHDGDTPILMAKRAEMLAVLIAAGADVNKEDRNGYQAIHEAMDMESIDLLLDAGADVNAVSGGGSWALREAALMGNAADVRHLLARGALADLTSSGETALFAAIRSGSLACVDLLLDAGADVNRMDADGWTCLWYVDDVSVARHLISRGADASLSEYGLGRRFPEECQFHEQNRELREFLRHCRLERQSGRG